MINRHPIQFEDFLIIKSLHTPLITVANWVQFAHTAHKNRFSLTNCFLNSNLMTDLTTSSLNYIIVHAFHVLCEL